MRSPSTPLQMIVDLEKTRLRHKAPVAGTQVESRWSSGLGSLDDSTSGGGKYEGPKKSEPEAPLPSYPFPPKPLRPIPMRERVKLQDGTSVTSATTTTTGCGSAAAAAARAARAEADAVEVAIPLFIPPPLPRPAVKNFDLFSPRPEGPATASGVDA